MSRRPCPAGAVATCEGLASRENLSVSPRSRVESEFSAVCVDEWWALT